MMDHVHIVDTEPLAEPVMPVAFVLFSATPDASGMFIGESTMMPVNRGRGTMGLFPGVTKLGRLSAVSAATSTFCRDS